MSAVVVERYSAIPIGVNTAVKTTATGMAGFLCITSGAITVQDGLGNTLVNAFPCTAGNFYPMPFRLQHSQSNNGSTITTSGGASGTLGLS